MKFPAMMPIALVALTLAGCAHVQPAASTSPPPRVSAPWNLEDSYE